MSIYGLWESEVFKKKQTVIITPIFCLWRQGSERNLTTLMFSVFCLIFTKQTLNLLVGAFLSVFGLDATVRCASTRFFRLFLFSFFFCNELISVVTQQCWHYCILFNSLNLLKKWFLIGCLWSFLTRNSKSVTFLLMKWYNANFPTPKKLCTSFGILGHLDLIMCKCINFPIICISRLLYDHLD